MEVLFFLKGLDESLLANFIGIMEIVDHKWFYEVLSYNIKLKLLNLFYVRFKFHDCVLIFALVKVRWVL